MSSGSSGTISGIILPTTGAQSATQGLQKSAMSATGPESVPGWDYGKVYEVDSEKLLVKVIGLSGQVTANDDWIPLAHSPREIIDRWGMVQKDMLAKVDYISVNGKMAMATIIRESNESIEDQMQETNTIKRSIFRIFSPGSGLT